MPPFKSDRTQGSSGWRYGSESGVGFRDRSIPLCVVSRKVVYVSTLNVVGLQVFRRTETEFRVRLRDGFVPPFGVST